ncbi:MAG: hypothetical protein OXQ86_00100 [Gammaproteobacteria bacterium]|nr:hypothetical protein [Gammaproteobacteria bacterium]MDE0413091.1 hypothetical protein [Gammaproteobacteria bacterium]
MNITLKDEVIVCMTKVQNGAAGKTLYFKWKDDDIRAAEIALKEAGFEWYDEILDQAINQTSAQGRNS